MQSFPELNKVFPNWTVKRLIGSGSYGKVYEIERDDGHAVYRSAMKVITIPQNESEIKSRLVEGESVETVSTYYAGVARSLLNENRVMAELRGNSNIVSYEDHQVIKHQDGIGCDIFIRMELLTSFIDYMAENNINEDVVIRLGIDLCRALEICEKKNIIHRDIKPGNIFVSDTGDFKLGDFGIARTIDMTSGGLSKKGTYRYMAPEVYKGEPYGKTVDICSLGLVMYYLMNANRTPFLPDAPATVSYNDEENSLLRRMKGERITPPKFASNKLSSIILKACAFDPRQRYQSASQMRRDLEALKADTFQGADASDQDATVGAWSHDPGRKPSAAMPVGVAVRQKAAPSATGMAPSAKAASVGSSTGTGSTNSQFFSKKGRGPLIAGIAAACTIVIAIGLFVFLSKDPGTDPDVTGSETSQDTVSELAKDIRVIDADIDWDSVEESDYGEYTVEGILYVENKSAVPVTDISYKSSYTGGEPIHSFLHDGDNSREYSPYLVATGYIGAGRKGIMVSYMNVDEADSKKKEQFQLDSFEITDVTENEYLKNYTVPSGRIINHTDDDHYDVSIDNYNTDVPVGENSTLVAVHIVNDTINEADATGTLDGEIPADTKDYRVPNAFYDPNLYVDYNDLVVYAIDFENLMKDYDEQ